MQFSSFLASAVPAAHELHAAWIMPLAGSLPSSVDVLILGHLFTQLQCPLHLLSRPHYFTLSHLFSYFLSIWDLNDLWNETGNRAVETGYRYMKTVLEDAGYVLTSLVHLSWILSLALSYSLNCCHICVFSRTSALTACSKNAGTMCI